MVLNRADECRQRADDCRRGAAQVTDDVLRVTYLDLARRWRIMAHEAECWNGKPSARKPIPRTAEQVSAFSGSWAGPGRRSLAPKKVAAAVALRVAR